MTVDDGSRKNIEKQTPIFLPVDQHQVGTGCHGLGDVLTLSHPPLSRHVVASDHNVLLLDPEWLLSQTRVIQHLHLGVEAVYVEMDDGPLVVIIFLANTRTKIMVVMVFFHGVFLFKFHQSPLPVVFRYLGLVVADSFV